VNGLIKAGLTPRALAAGILAAGLWGTAMRPAAAADRHQFDLLTAGVTEIQAAVSAGSLTYERLVQLYLNRIEAFDRRGVSLHAVIEINPRAVEIARELDRERQASGLRSPLHGIPIAVKDNIDVSDLPSAGGSLSLAGTFPARDATVIRRLRDAGAIIFLKTNMDEFALGSQGLSSLGGQILNPFDLKRNPGGSSGGTGVAISAGFATLGLATETGVSIRSPAVNNSVVGVAPSRGLVSRAGVIPISFTQDRVGAHARSVADAALLLTHIRGVDADDLLTWQSLGQVDAAPYTSVLDWRALAGARVGVLDDLFRRGGQFEPVNTIIRDQIAMMRQKGAVVVEGLTTGMDLVSLFPALRVNRFEWKFALDAYLRRRGGSGAIRTMDDLAASGKYLESLRPRFEEASKLDQLDFDADYRARLSVQARVRQQLIDVMNRTGVEVLAYPFKSLGAPLIGTSDSGIRDNPISSTTGLPAVVVPAGVNDEGLPVSLEFLGRPFSEATLLRVAYSYERISNKRVLPPTTPHLPGEQFAY
jgi:Asp-tRNA(Asn)/Glu-tRNA(Gln) amidotransferase A subunit family amidase